MTCIKMTKRKKRKGIMSMELVLTLPILMLVLFAVFEYSLLFYARAEVVEASRIGARAASYPGAVLENVEQSVVDALGPQLSRDASVSTERGEFSGDGVTVIVKVPMSDAAPDLLWPIGFGLRERYLVSKTYMEME